MTAIAYLLLLSQSLTYGKQAWERLPLHLGLVLWTGLAIGLIALLFAPRAQDRLDQGATRVLRGRYLWVVLAIANAAMQWLAYRRFIEFGYSAPWMQLAACIVATYMFLTTELTSWQRAAIGCGLSLVILIAAIFTCPLDAHRSDMLPVIRAALDHWAAGDSPYSPLELAGYGRDRMPYLPGVLFSHVPAWLLGLDLRWNTVLLRALWMRLALRKGCSWDGLAIFALNPALNFRHDLYFEFFLLVVALFWLVPRLRWLWIPLGVITRQWFWVAAPFLVLHEMRAERGFARLGRIVAASVGLGLACWLALRGSSSWDDFRGGVFVFQGRIGMPVYLEDLGLTFAPAFFGLGWAHAMQLVQAGVCVFVFVWAVVRKQDLLRAATICWVGFVAFNPHFWSYFWMSVGLWVLLAHPLNHRTAPSALSR